jgi:hypothetical protein
LSRKAFALIGSTFLFACLGAYISSSTGSHTAVHRGRRRGRGVVGLALGLLAILVAAWFDRRPGRPDRVKHAAYQPSACAGLSGAEFQERPGPY